MGKINVLSMDIANKIAAGEVVERPASVIKELVENAVDAGSTAITVEIKNGGITYMRVTDNGCGMGCEDIKTAFLRHATSKLASLEDLEHIASLGFRGEALSSIASVSHIEILSRETNSVEGYSLKISGGEIEDEGIAGCPDGTTIVVKDLFYNTPARMKFLKLDRTEGGYISDIMQRLAMSRPDIAVKFIADGNVRLQTDGDNQLTSCIYSIYGKDYVKDIKKVSFSENGMTVHGIIGLPVLSRANRRFQSFFVNGRYVRSNTLTHAAEEAYKNKLMVGKFPFFVLNIEIPYGQVDINVHPAKTEIKFSDDKTVYQSVYWAVYNTLMSGDMPITPIKKELSKPFHFTQPPIKQDQEECKMQSKAMESDLPLQVPKPAKYTFEMTSPVQAREIIHEIHETLSHKEGIPKEPEQPNLLKESVLPFDMVSLSDKEDNVEYKIIGQVFDTYIILQMDNEIILIDQHAAHERQIYEKLIQDNKLSPQMLLIPTSIILSGSEFSIICENLAFFEKIGFVLEEFGNNSIVIRQTPIDLPQDELKNLLLEITENVAAGKRHVQGALQDRALYTVACKAAIKANKILSREEMKFLVDWVLSQKGVDTCPHGRPLTYKFTKNDIEKRFKRV